MSAQGFGYSAGDSVAEISLIAKVNATLGASRPAGKTPERELQPTYFVPFRLSHAFLRHLLDGLYVTCYVALVSPPVSLLMTCSRRSRPIYVYYCAYRFLALHLQ